MNDLLVSAAAIIGGLLALAYGAILSGRAWSTHDWHRTVGTITDSWLDDPQRQSSPPFVRYEYEYGGEKHVGSAICVGGKPGVWPWDPVVADLDARRTALARYRSGGVVTVHVNPKNPGDAVLEPGVQGPVWVYLSLGFVLACLGLAYAVLHRS